MTLQDIFEQLTYGELSQLVLGGMEPPADYTGDPAAYEPEINEAHKKQLIGHIELALTALYKRFYLRKKQMGVRLIANKSFYVLAPKYAVTSTTSTETNRYILDAEDPLAEAILKINEIELVLEKERIINGVKTNKVPAKLNIVGNPQSIVTSSANTLRVPDSFFHGAAPEPIELLVHYHAGHPQLNKQLSIYAPSTVTIDLPGTHLQALLYYVASRVMNPTGMVQEFHSGNSYYAKYEAECQRLTLENVDLDEESEKEQFSRQGFV